MFFFAIVVPRINCVRERDHLQTIQESLVTADIKDELEFYLHSLNREIVKGEFARWNRIELESSNDFQTNREEIASAHQGFCAGGAKRRTRGS